MSEESTLYYIYLQYQATVNDSTAFKTKIIKQNIQKAYRIVLGHTEVEGMYSTCVQAPYAKQAYMKLQNYNMRREEYCSIS